MSASATTTIVSGGAVFHEPSDRRPNARAITAPVLLLALFVVPMGLSGTSVALPSIARDLSADESLLQATVNGFNIAFAVGTLGWGIVSDRIGYRRVFRLGVIAYLAAALTSAAARDFTLMII